jgi:hypothetical protein
MVVTRECGGEGWGDADADAKNTSGMLGHTWCMGFLDCDVYWSL